MLWKASEVYAMALEKKKIIKNINKLIKKHLNPLETIPRRIKNRKRPFLRPLKLFTPSFFKSQPLKITTKTRSIVEAF